MPRYKPVPWWRCMCHRSGIDHPCDRMIYEGRLCGICTIGCAELVLVAPADIPVLVKKWLTHIPMNPGVPV